MNKVWDVKAPEKDVPDMFGMELGWLNDFAKKSRLRQHQITMINIKYGKKIVVKHG